MSLTKLSLGGNYLIIPTQGEFGQWRLGTGKPLTFFTVYFSFFLVKGVDRFEVKKVSQKEIRTDYLIDPYAGIYMMFIREANN
jgi:hypothetical protein